VKQQLEKPDILTLGSAASVISKQTGQRIAVWQIRNLFTRGLLPQCHRLGNFRVVTSKDVPALIAGLTLAGYLKTPDPSLN
jgi:hypothetical protein